MRAGQLRHKVVIQTGTDTVGTEGGVTQVWGTFATRQASIEPLTGQEQFQAQQVFASATHQVGIRYLAGLTPKMRLLFGTRIFEVLGVRNLEERNREMVVLCEERLNVAAA